MGGSTVSVPPKDAGQIALEKAQAENVKVQTEFMRQQMASNTQTQKLLKSLAPTSADRAALQRFQSANISLQLEALGIQRQTLADNKSLQAGELEYKLASLDVANSQLELMKAEAVDAQSLRAGELEYRQKSLDVSSKTLELIELQTNNAAALLPGQLANEKERLAIAREELGILKANAESQAALQPLQDENQRAQLELSILQLGVMKREAETNKELAGEEKAFRQETLALAREQLQFAKGEAENARGLQAGEFELKKKQLAAEQQKFDLLVKEINKGPTEFEQSLQKLGMLSIERVNAAIEGRQPANEALKQAEADELKQFDENFSIAKEQLAGQGINISGKSLATATGRSTSEIGNIKNFQEGRDRIKKKYLLAREEDRQSIIRGGSSTLIDSFNAYTGIQDRKVSLLQGSYLSSSPGSVNYNPPQTGLLLPGSPNANFAGYNPSSPGGLVYQPKQTTGLNYQGSGTPTVQNPIGSAVGLIQNAGSFGVAQTTQGFNSLNNAYTQAIKPYQYQQGLQFQANQQTAANSAALTSSLFSGAGLAAGLAFSSRKFKKNIYKHTKKDHRKSITLVKKDDIYEYHYKDEPDNRKKHIGLIAEEAYTATPDKKAVDVYSQVSLLTSATKGLILDIEKLKKRKAA